MKEPCCSRCHHPEYTIEDHEYSTKEYIFKPLITCTKCKNTWAYGRDPEFYVNGKFAIDKRKFK